MTRSISSHEFQPTSPIHSSLVPGRVVMRNGLRNPIATIRRTLGSVLDAFGLSGIAAPVAGSTRMTAPSSVVGSPGVRRSCARSAPPCRGRRSLRATDRNRGVPARVLRVPALAVVGRGEGGTVACARIQRAVGAEQDGTDRMGRVLLAPVVDEHLLGPGHDVARRLQARQPSADDAAVDVGSRRCRAGVVPDRRCVPDRCVECVQHVDVRLRRERRVERHPENPVVVGAVDLGAQIGEHRRLRRGPAGEHFDEPGFLRNEDATVGGEPHRHRLGEPAEDRRLLEPGRQRPSASCQR